MDWTTEEFSSVQLGDERLSNRLMKLADQFVRQPDKSIPAKCRSWPETKAAYRFFDNEKVTASAIVQPHVEATLARMQPHPVVLFVQDTTVLNYTGQPERTNTGPTVRNNTKGMFLHPTLAVTPERLCLGVVHYEQWFRTELSKKSQGERSCRNHARTPQEKESYRWVRSYQQTNDYASKLANTTIVNVADREGDLFELYKEAQQTLAQGGAQWLIRASFDRRLSDETGKVKQTKLIETVKGHGEKGRVQFNLSARKNKPARTIELAIYFAEVHLSPTRRQRKKPGYIPIKTTVVIASEVNAPAGEEPLEWVLLTSMPVETVASAREIIDWYQCRWQIEIYFKVLKSGCKVEKLQITDEERFDPCLALHMITAWRILYMTLLGRECSDVSCEIVFDQIEWQTAYIVLKKEKPPSAPPRLSEMIKMIASLGGFLNRKSDGYPGPAVLWRGLASMRDHVQAREAFELVFGHTYG